MRRIVLFSLMVGVVSLSVTGLSGCGGSESGTQQITEKLPDNPEAVAGKGAAKKPATKD